MLFILLSIICNGSIAIIFRFTERRDLNRYAINAFNYLVAVMISYIMLPSKVIFEGGWLQAFGDEAYKVFSQGIVFSPKGTAGWSVLLGIITGALYFGGFWLYQYNVNKSGVPISATFMKLGILVPVLLSMLWFKEIPTFYQLIGIIVAIAAIAIINTLPGENFLKSFKPALLLMFATGGMADFNSKVYQVYGGFMQNELFIFYIFLSALIISLVMLVFKDRKFKKYDVLGGLAVGIPNQLASYFFIKALEGVKASLAFSIFSTGAILFVTIVNIFFFKEKMRKRQYFAMSGILLSLVLMNI